MNTEAPRRIYAITQVASFVGVHPSSVIDAEKAGRITAARRDELGARWYTARDRDRVAAAMGRR